MKTFHLIISSPDGSYFDGETEALSLHGTEGDLAILAGHIPFITAVRMGPCKLTMPDGTERRGIAAGGLLTVSSEVTTLLTSDFHWET